MHFVPIWCATVMVSRKTRNTRIARAYIKHENVFDQPDSRRLCLMPLMCQLQFRPCLNYCFFISRAYAKVKAVAWRIFCVTSLSPPSCVRTRTHTRTPIRKRDWRKNSFCSHRLFCFSLLFAQSLQWIPRVHNTNFYRSLKTVFNGLHCKKSQRG